MLDYRSAVRYDDGMTTTLNTPQTPTSQLTFQPGAESGIYVGEISSTNGFGRVYADACDEGLILVGRSGLHVPFVVDGIVREDGEIVAWRLVVVPGADVPAHVRRLRVTLFND